MFQHAVRTLKLRLKSPLEKWIHSFGRDRVPNTTELESAVFFAAAVVPLVMQVFESEELALFANGSLLRIPNVWRRIVEWDCMLHENVLAVKKSKLLWIRCFCCCQSGSALLTFLHRLPSYFILLLAAV